MRFWYNVTLVSTFILLCFIVFATMHDTDSGESIREKALKHRQAMEEKVIQPAPNTP